MTTSKELLAEIFNQDFSQVETDEAFRRLFFAKRLTPAELYRVFRFIRGHHVICGSRTIPDALHIKGRHPEGEPFAVLAMLHGNEPAGLPGILLALVLAETGRLERDVIAVLGNAEAAEQYFAHWLAHPDARQESRDAYRCGLDADGGLLPDMNRIPIDFQDRDAGVYHHKRAQALFTLGQHIGGILDIHSARGNMLCITDHKHDSELKNSPIRAILTGLAEAISAHASAQVTVQTLKTLLSPLPNIQHQVGIEAGRHEDPEALIQAASFTLSLLHTLGITNTAPLYQAENGQFSAYHVQPRITYADLEQTGNLRDDDRVYMAKAFSPSPLEGGGVETALIVRQGDGIYKLQSHAEYAQHPAGEAAYAVHQYEEMETIEKGQVVAVAVPSGTVFCAPLQFATLFISKSAALYDKDSSVGPWPVALDKLSSTKFCYPCQVQLHK